MCVYIYTSLKSLGSVVFFSFFLRINTFIQQGSFKLIESDSKDIYICYKVMFSQINADLLNFIKESLNLLVFLEKYESTQLFSILIIIITTVS